MLIFIDIQRVEIYLSKYRHKSKYIESMTLQIYYYSIGSRLLPNDWRQTVAFIVFELWLQIL